MHTNKCAVCLLYVQYVPCCCKLAAYIYILVYEYLPTLHNTCRQVCRGTYLLYTYPVVVEPQGGERGDGRAGFDVLKVVLVQHQRLQRREAHEVGERPATNQIKPNRTKPNQTARRDERKMASEEETKRQKRRHHK